MHPGLMDASGHDGHTAIGLGVAEILAALQPRLRGTCRLIFQPGEEGGKGQSAHAAGQPEKGRNAMLDAALVHELDVEITSASRTITADFREADLEGGIATIALTMATLGTRPRPGS